MSLFSDFVSGLRACRLRIGDGFLKLGVASWPLNAYSFADNVIYSRVSIRFLVSLGQKKANVFPLSFSVI